LLKISRKNCVFSLFSWILQKNFEKSGGFSKKTLQNLPDSFIIIREDERSFLLILFWFVRQLNIFINVQYIFDDCLTISRSPVNSGFFYALRDYL